MLRFFLICLAFASAFAISGCSSTRGGPIPYDVANFGRPDAQAAATVDSNYRIAPLDVLAIRVFESDNISGEYQVDLTGNIGVPLIGIVSAVGQSPQELQRTLSTRLAKYIHEPDVNVGVKSSTQSSVTVDGSVRQPGIFPVMGKTTLMQIIAQARGLDENANEHRVAIFRQIEGKRMAAAFDLETIRRGATEDPEVHSGDLIIVDGSKVKAARRDILQALPVLSIFRVFTGF